MGDAHSQPREPEWRARGTLEPSRSRRGRRGRATGRLRTLEVAGGVDVDTCVAYLRCGPGPDVRGDRDSAVVDLDPWPLLHGRSPRAGRPTSHRPGALSLGRPPLL